MEIGDHFKDRVRRGAMLARREILKDVRAVGNTWALATSRSIDSSLRERHHPSESRRGVWPAYPPAGYLGQLKPKFQEQLAMERSAHTIDDCMFYHTSDFSDGKTILGPWDLRGVESAYLGGINVAGDRILEFGPASGALTWYMEREGAEVVTFDIGYDVCGDILPSPDVDFRQQQLVYLNTAVIPVQNSWWYLYGDRGSRAKAVYGNIYSLPGDLGEYDTSVFAAILLHLRDPFLALQQAAVRTKRRIVIAEPLQDPSLEQSQNVARFGSAGLSNLSIWWTFTPEGIRHMLKFLGFNQQTTTFSSHVHYLGHDLSRPPVNINMFTVVAERSD